DAVEGLPLGEAQRRDGHGQVGVGGAGRAVREAARAAPRAAGTVQGRDGDRDGGRGAGAVLGVVYGHGEGVVPALGVGVDPAEGEAAAAGADDAGGLLAVAPVDGGAEAADGVVGPVGEAAEEAAPLLAGGLHRDRLVGPEDQGGVGHGGAAGHDQLALAP